MKMKRGAGITAYTVERIEAEGDDARQALQQFIEAKNKGDFHFTSREARSVIAAILNDEDGSFVEEHSKKDFALQIQRNLKLADRMIAEGQADKAADFAFSAASAWATMVMKFSWELDALRGEKVAGGGRNSARQTNDRHVPLRQERFNLIKLLMDQGSNPESAFAACEAEGLGNAEAIKRQWYRHQNGDT